MLCEKNEVINLEINPKISSHSENIRINNYPHRTINEYLKNGQHFHGSDWFKYSAYKNNCQDFILSILKGNNINEGINFVKQDTEQIFRDSPIMRRFANTITDVAGRFDVIKQGGSISTKNGLSSLQIDRILKNRDDFMGCFMKNELPERLYNNSWYIVNMESSNDGNGTHWCCLKTGKNNFWYDAFGFAPPIEVLQKIHGSLKYNDRQIQNEKSTACGFFCIACILSDNEYSDDEMHFKRFLSNFSDYTCMNDIILKKLLDKFL